MPPAAGTRHHAPRHEGTTGPAHFIIGAGRERGIHQPVKGESQAVNGRKNAYFTTSTVPFTGCHSLSFDAKP